MSCWHRAAFLALAIPACASTLSATQQDHLSASYRTRDQMLQYANTIMAFQEATGVMITDERALQIWRRIDFSFEAGPVGCGDASSGYSGCTELLETGRYRVRVYVNGCLASSSYTHEILHVLMMEVVGSMDPDHETKAIWPIDRSDPRPNPMAAYWLATAAGFATVCPELSGE